VLLKKGLQTAGHNVSPQTGSISFDTMLTLHYSSTRNTINSRGSMHTKSSIVVAFFILVKQKWFLRIIH